MSNLESVLWPLKCNALENKNLAFKQYLWLGYFHSLIKCAYTTCHLSRICIFPIGFFTFSIVDTPSLIQRNLTVNVKTNQTRIFLKFFNRTADGSRNDINYSAVTEKFWFSDATKNSGLAICIVLSFFHLLPLFM